MEDLFVQFGHLVARGTLIESGFFERFGFGESLVDKTEDVGAIALLLALATGDFGFDEPRNALLQVADLIGLIQKLRGYRDAGHRDEIITTWCSCKVALGIASGHSGAFRKEPGPAETGGSEPQMALRQSGSWAVILPFICLRTGVLGRLVAAATYLRLRLRFAASAVSIRVNLNAALNSLSCLSRRLGCG
jgi:hypothetical protein